MMKDRAVRVTSIQLERRDQSKPEIVADALRSLDAAPPSDLFLLPELWPSGFFNFENYPLDAEPIDGPVVTAFKRKAVDRGCHILMGSFIERQGKELFNSSLLLDPQGRVIAAYRKIHLFGFQSREREILTQGREIVVADMPWGKAGIATCYDLRFPELFRKMIDLGAEYLLIVSAWPAARLDAWLLFNRARAHENLAYVVACNCAGQDAGTTYAGHSIVVDPLGSIVVEGGSAECMVTAEIDPLLVRSTRHEFSALRDRVLT